MGNNEDTSRALIETTVAERCKHSSWDQFCTTVTLAEAERLLGREYHGRFLIELLQNAADAWRSTGRTGLSEVRVVIESDPPALTVANYGSPFPASTVLDSLGQIGQSTKAAGESIGHKGIGFKSVLEVTDTPQLFSDFNAGIAGLAVRFDAKSALEQIGEVCPSWHEWARRHEHIGEDALRAVPTLRHPTWEEEVPPVVAELGAEGFDTVIRLPFTGPNGDRQKWSETIHESLKDIDDQILVLLGCFSRVVVDDRISGEHQEIVFSESEAPVRLSDRSSRSRVTVTRSGVVSSRWELYRRHGGSDLADDAAVGVRLDVDDPRVPVHATSGQRATEADTHRSSPFHLFFPTSIGSGLPFLVHGYFEVDAARTGFFRGSTTNVPILETLSDLAVSAIANLASRQVVDLAALLDLIARTQAPENETVVRQFREPTLTNLDGVDWLPTHGGGAPARLRDVIVAPASVVQPMCDTFTAGYVRSRVSLAIVSPTVSERGLEFLVARASLVEGGAETLWDSLAQLLRPGAVEIWDLDQADKGFLSLLDLAEALRSWDKDRWLIQAASLPGDPAARIIPVTSKDARRRMATVPVRERSDGTGGPGDRRNTIMARVHGREHAALLPPASMGVAFVSDGVFASEDELRRAEEFNVRPFTVDAVLDTLRNHQQIGNDSGEVLSFMWSLLNAADASEYGVSRAVSRVDQPRPEEWFWLKPGRAGSGATPVRAQNRERSLCSVLLPAADGIWRPAGELAFGADWADWVEAYLGGPSRRVNAMRRLQRLAPGPEALLAKPEEVLPYLPEEEDAERARRRQFAFLLRLGCWEVLPVEGVVGRPEGEGQRQDCPNWAWGDQRATMGSRDDAPWLFGSSEPRAHRNAYVVEDWRLAWSIDNRTFDLAEDLTAAIIDGASLYETLGKSHLACRKCRRHNTRYQTSDEERRDSTLALQLRHARWLVARKYGEVDKVVRPNEAWWRSSPLEGGAGLIQLQHVWLVAGERWSQQMRGLVGLHSLEDAPMTRLLELHTELRSQLGNDEEEFSGVQARQAFIRLHRLMYQRVAELEQSVPEVLAEIGRDLKYLPIVECRHDDGRQATFKGRFAGQVPFVVLARSQGAVAKSLGIEPFKVEVRRLGDDGVDVTSSLTSDYGDRIPELLAIMVHRGVGGSTLDPSSEDFHIRSRRLRALTVRRVTAMELELTVPGLSQVGVTDGSDIDESFLEGGTTSHPVIYQGLSGVGWQMRLRSRLGSHIAEVVEVPGLADAFRLLLTGAEDEREDLLHEWGIGDQEIDDLRGQVGAVSHLDAASHRIWFASIVSVVNGERYEDRDVVLEPSAVVSLLVSNRFDHATAAKLSRLGGWASSRRGAGVDSALPILVRAGVDLAQLSQELSSRGEPTLRVTAALELLRRWQVANSQRVAAALVCKGMEESTAKTALGDTEPPTPTQFQLDPVLQDVLAPVARLLNDGGVDVTAEALAESPAVALARAIGISVSDLDKRAGLLFNAEARESALRGLAREWREELIHLVVLQGCAGQGTSAVRRAHQKVQAEIPRVSTPSGLHPHVDVAFAARLPILSSALIEKMSDDPFSPVPARRDILRFASESGLRTHDSDRIRTVTTSQRTSIVASLERRGRELAAAGIRPVLPDLIERRPDPSALNTDTLPRDKVAKSAIAAVKFDIGMERRRKELGDDGEEWVIAAVVAALRGLDDDHRVRAIDQMITLLRDHFTEPSILELLAAGDSARESGLDDEELAERLHSFVHASALSDNFGFDVLGWIPNADGTDGRALALEVKSSGSKAFMLSAGEWKRAQELYDASTGESQYAVLVVRRDRTSSPEAMDLLIDPVQLDRDHQLSREVDGFRVSYATR